MFYFSGGWYQNVRSKGEFSPYLSSFPLEHGPPPPPLFFSLCSKQKVFFSSFARHPGKDTTDFNFYISMKTSMKLLDAFFWSIQDGGENIFAIKKITVE